MHSSLQPPHVAALGIMLVELCRVSRTLSAHGVDGFDMGFYPIDST
jgi:hypothetical protein